MANTLEVQIAASVGEFQRQIGQAASSLRQAAQQMGADFSRVGPAANEAGSGVDRFSELLREHRKEHVQTARAVSAFTKEISGIIGPGNEAAKVLGSLLGGLAIGGGFGVALEAVKVGIELVVKKLGEAKEIAKEAHEQFVKSIDAVRAGVTTALDGIQKEIDKAGLIRPAAILQRQADAAKEIAAKHARELAAAVEDASRPHQGESVRSWEKRKANFDKERKALEEDAAAWDARARAAQEEADTARDAEDVAQSRTHHQTMLGLEAQFLTGKKKLVAEFEAEVNRIRAREGAKPSANMVADDDAEIARRRDLLNKALADLESKQALAVARSGRTINDRERSAAELNPEWEKERQQKKKADLAFDVAETKRAEDEKIKDLQEAKRRGDKILAEQQAEIEREGRAWVRLGNTISSAFAQGFTQSLFHAQSFEEGIKAVFDAIEKAFERLIEQMVEKLMSSIILSFLGDLLGGPVGGFVASQAGAGIVSLDVGTWNVPHDTLAQIHQGEIVVPPDISADVRAGRASIGAPLSAAGGGHVTLNITTLDAQSFRQFLTGRGASGLLGALYDHRRNGRL